jgi:hypothetical protein
MKTTNEINEKTNKILNKRQTFKKKKKNILQDEIRRLQVVNQNRGLDEVESELLLVRIDLLHDL